ncbi:MAG: ArdC-like ssDNA-binding domain-containing protein [Lactococcus hircilactis]
MKKNKKELNQMLKDKDTKALNEHLKEGVKNYLKSDTLKEFLKFCSKFPKYSYGNVRLIESQAPDAHHVASFKKWKDLGTSVKKGSKAVYIYAPSTYKVKDKNGKVIKDEKGEAETKTYFKLVPVFTDQSVEHPELLPQQVYAVKGDFEDKDTFVNLYRTFMKVSPVPVLMDNINGTAHGYYDVIKNNIVIQANMGQLQTVKTMIHEITHAMLHSNSSAVFGDRDYQRQEFEAESVAYVVSNHLGIDSSEYSFGYLASWTQGGKTIDDFEESLKTITKTATELNTKIDETFARISDQTLSKPKNKFEERLQKLETKRPTVPKNTEHTSDKEETENASLKGQPSHQMNHR